MASGLMSLSRTTYLALLAVLLTTIICIAVAATSSADTSGPEDPMWQLGYSNGGTLTYAGEGSGPLACRALIEVSDSADAGWATDSGREAFFDGCVTAYDD